jgi:hypothetical protein
VAVCILSVLGVASKGVRAAASSDPFELIRRVRSPRELITEHFPGSYCVPVTMSGKVAKQLHSSVRALDLDRPRLVETLDKKTSFRLKVDNAGYPAETRELLSGMINISDMVERVLSSVVKYKEETQLQLLQSHASVEIASASAQRQNRCDILFTPKGDRFGYEYVDMGSYVYEIWLTRMRISMDTVTNLVYSVEMDKFHTGSMLRNYKADSVLQKRIEYRINYDTIGAARLPAQLSIVIDGRQQLEIHAAYRSFDSHVVFKSRKICYFASDSTSPATQSPSCLKMEYGTYHKGSSSCIEHPGTKTSPRRQYKKLAYAGALARKAREAMDEGNIHKASRILKKLLRHCPDTPQGIEAQNILSVLPGY